MASPPRRYPSLLDEIGSASAFYYYEDEGWYVMIERFIERIGGNMLLPEFALRVANLYAAITVAVGVKRKTLPLKYLAFLPVNLLYIALKLLGAFCAIVSG